MPLWSGAGRLDAPRPGSSRGAVRLLRAECAQAGGFAALLSAVVVLTGTIAAVIAALAALATVIYARRTVVDGRDAHRELMAAQKEAREGFAPAVMVSSLP